jgi:TetR/AcrR family transcriptional regulator, transcriptional repressor for nem operon
MSEMTDSIRAAGKRERLVEGARAVLHAQGVDGTTLADIAQAAEVPLGNVYYYFKTKDELVDAVVASRVQDVRDALRGLEQHRTPKARLKAFVRMLVGEAEETARYGCPNGTLCSELDKHEDGPGQACVELMGLPIDWAEQQFRAMGRRDARELAVGLIASYQGIALLTNTFSDPQMMASEGRRLERWIDSLG